jgi:hypothetical protein
MSVRSVAVAGSIAQRPARGGHAWVFLNYLLGLRELGHEAIFIDSLTPEMTGSRDGEIRHSPQARWLDRVMVTNGLGDCYFLLDESSDGRQSGCRARLLDRLRSTDLLLNVNGFLRDPELLAAPAVKAFVDIDPAIQQMWEALGLAEIFAGHDLYFTVGENIGRPACAVPTCGRQWMPIHPPVSTDRWSASARGQGFTTVASWRGPYGPIVYEGETFGLRAHEFRGMTQIARKVDVKLAVALDIDAADRADADRLHSAGWRLLDPREVAGDPAAYQAFIHSSEAELSIAKNVYVRSRCGWFSDRSACYLASGRPVIAQDTGYSENLPTGSGLISFTNPDEAVAGIEEVHRDWRRHSEAAREIAVEYFDASRVLKGMLDVAGL